MAEESNLSSRLATPNQITEEEKALFESQLRGGFVPIPTSLYLRVLTYAATFSDISEMLLDIQNNSTKPPKNSSGSPKTKGNSMPRLRLALPKPSVSAKPNPKVVTDSTGRKVLAAVKGTAKDVGRAVLGIGSYDALLAWSDDNPETKALIEIALERGGLAFDELMKSEDGRQILIREAAKRGAPVSVKEEDDDNVMQFDDARPEVGDAVWMRDSKNGEVLAVLQALNITTTEYITLLRSVRSHTAEDVIEFQRTRERYGLPRM